MTNLSFPDTEGQLTDGSFTYEANGVIYSWNGEYWSANNSENLDQRYVEVSGDTMTGDLVMDSANILVDGNIGIGTNSPSEKLDVIGNGQFEGNVLINNPLDNTAARSKQVKWIFSDGDGASIISKRDTGTTSSDVFLQLRAGGAGSANSVLTCRPTGNVEIRGKATSASTVSGDSGTTLVTKDYLDAIDGGLDDRYVNLDGDTMTGTLFMDGAVINVGGTEADPNITLNADGSAQFAGDVNCSSMNGGALAGYRNVVMNGLFAVDQRSRDGTTLANTNYITKDRWCSVTQGNSNNVAVAHTVVNLGSEPNKDGAANALRYETSAAMPHGNSTNLYLSQKIDGRDFRAMCGWTGNADTDRPITLSFWVRSSKTGTYSVSLQRDPTGIGPINLHTYVAAYQVNAADTWEKKSMTIPAPAEVFASITSYVALRFHVWGGTNRRVASNGWQDVTSQIQIVSPDYNANWGDAAGATFDITAIQLEPGPNATPFEYRPYFTEFQLCERYYQTSGNQPWNDTGSSMQVSGLHTFIPANASDKYSVRYPVEMRALVSLSIKGATHVENQMRRTGGSVATGTITLDQMNRKGFSFTTDVASTRTYGFAWQADGEWPIN